MDAAADLSVILITLLLPISQHTGAEQAALECLLCAAARGSSAAALLFREMPAAHHSPATQSEMLFKIKTLLNNAAFSVSHVKTLKMEETEALCRAQ